MSKRTYAVKFKDPRWQKRRLEVMNDFGWHCQMCMDSDTTLHVHHRYYRRDTDPWDYPDTAFAVLCETCHEEETPRRKAAQQRLIEAVMSQLFARDTLDLAAAIASALDTAGLPEVTCTALCLKLEDREAVNALVSDYMRSIGKKA